MKKVFVSGGSGYIALHCIARLIQKGYFVKTSIRSLSRKQEVIDSISKVVDCVQKNFRWISGQIQGEANLN